MRVKLLCGHGEAQHISAAARICACLFAAVLTSFALCGPAAAAKLKVLHEFGGSDGADPTGGLVVDPDTGTLYGTAIFGGGGDGTVFSLTPPPPGGRRWKFDVLYTFKGGFDGSRPATGLAIGPDALYGTTLKGSSVCDCGAVFALSPTDSGEWQKTTIHEFSGDDFDGIVPNSAPVLDASFGRLYGTTGSIGGSGGTIFYIKLTGATYDTTVIYNPGQNVGHFVGYHPQGVTLDGNTVYGTAFDGAYSGTIFQLDTMAGTGTILHGFSGPDGAGPQAPPIRAADGTLYGTASQGGNPKDCPNSPGCGVIWKQTATREKVLHSFKFFTHNHDGMDPISPLVLDEQTGTLYGTTYYGGTGTNCGGDGGSCGTIFSIDAAGRYTLLWDFPKGGPANPQGLLVFHDGVLYGTSYDGGKACPDQHYIGCGTVWKLTP